MTLLLRPYWESTGLHGLQQQPPSPVFVCVQCTLGHWPTHAGRGHALTPLDSLAVEVRGRIALSVLPHPVHGSSSITPST